MAYFLLFHPCCAGSWMALQRFRVGVSSSVAVPHISLLFGPLTDTCRRVLYQIQRTTAKRWAKLRRPVKEKEELIKIMPGEPTEAVDPSLWELMDSALAAGEPAWDQPRPSACDGSCIA